jgi:hypothetical protein
MGNLENRIAMMEAQCATKKYKLTPEQDEAAKRIFAALDIALLEKPTTDQLSKCGSYMEAVHDPHGQRSGATVCALRDRMVTDTMTEEDQRVLDSLPQDDLALLGIPAEIIIKALAEFDDEYRDS